MNPSPQRYRLAVLTFWLLLGLAQPALAVPSGIRRDVWMSPIFITNRWLDANVPYIIETSDLQPVVGGGTPDTVLHVQNADVAGSFLAGNDDFSSGYESRVQIVVPTGRWVHVIVRAFSVYSHGTADVTIDRAGVVQRFENRAFGGDNIPTVSNPLAAATHVWTQQHFDGPEDTLLLVACGSPYNAVAFDDDDGVGLQSWLHLDATCVNPNIYFGRRGTGQEGPGTVAWDGDIHVADADADGLGNSFENVLTTATNDRDTDDDGLDDAAEAIGIDGAQPQKLFTWGADPKVKDAFVEVDWVECVDPGCVGPDDFRTDAASASTLVSHYAPDIRVHLDIGRTNSATTKAEWTKWGSWMGAKRSAWSGEANCGTLTSARVGAFHHYHITGPGEGGYSIVVGACGFGANGERTMTHELGHQLSLGHGGNAGSGLMNNKPHYVSVINYGYSHIPGVPFSRNANANITLNPSSLNEVSSGLSAALLTTLANHPFYFMTDPVAGRIDWNRDRQYDTAVRGAPTWVLGSASSEFAAAWNDQVVVDAKAPTLARLSNPQRLYLFSRRPSDGKVQYRYTNGLSCPGGDGVGSCANWIGPIVIEASEGGDFLPPAAHRVVVNGEEKMMVVYRSGSGALVAQTGNQFDVWSTPQVVYGSTTLFVQPELVPAGVGGKLRAYFGVWGILGRRDFDPSSGTWSTAAWEKRASDGASLAVGQGISVTEGYEDGITGPSWYAAIVNQAGVITLWRYSATADGWTELPNVWASGQVATDAAPALAYVPTSTSDPTKGQFYLVYNPSASTNPAKLLQILKTEGNGLTTGQSRRFQFSNASIPFFNEWLVAEGSPALLYEIGVDTNLRATFDQKDEAVPHPDRPRWIWFLPVADGMPNLALKDQDDYFFMREMADCALGAGGCLP